MSCTKLLDVLLEVRVLLRHKCCSKWCQSLNKSYVLDRQPACSRKQLTCNYAKTGHKLGITQRLTTASLPQQSLLCTRQGCMGDKQDQQLAASQNKHRTLVAWLSSSWNLLSQAVASLESPFLPYAAGRRSCRHKNGQMAVQE